MYCRTDTGWLFWSRGEASVLNHHSWMKIGIKTMLVCAEVFGFLNLVCCHFCHLDPQIWRTWV